VLFVIGRMPIRSFCHAHGRALLNISYDRGWRNSTASDIGWLHTVKRSVFLAIGVICHSVFYARSSLAMVSLDLNWALRRR